MVRIKLTSLVPWRRSQPPEITSDFSVLPPRVIIEKILAYHEVETRSLVDNQFLLFGHFKKANIRHIWFVFPSLCLETQSNDKDEKLPVIIKFERLVHLNISNPTIKILKTIRYTSPSMLFLSSLEITSGGNHSMFRLKDVTREFSRVFSNQKCFPKLKKLRFITVDNTKNDDNLRSEIVEEWNETKFEIPFDLKSLRLCFQNCYSKNTEFLPKMLSKNMKSLKVLSLYQTKMANEVILVLPFLERIKMGQTENIRVIPGSRVSSLEVSSVDAKYLREVYTRQTNGTLTLLDVINIRNWDEASSSSSSWFLNEYFHPDILKNLKILDLGSLKINTDLNFLESCKNTLEVLNISYWTIYSHDLNHTFPNLRRMTLKSTEIVEYEEEGNHNHKYLTHQFSAPNLKTLVFGGSHSVSGDVKIPESFFLSPFQNLTSAYLHKSSSLIGKGWNSNFCSPRLKYLSIVYCGNFSNSFFEEQDLSNLVGLRLYNVADNVDGRNWKTKVFRNLKILVITSLPFFRDDLFFKENSEFPKLSRLELSGLDRITGCNWNTSLLGVKRISISGCDLVADSDVLKDRILKKKSSVIKKRAPVQTKRMMMGTMRKFGDSCEYCEEYDNLKVCRGCKVSFFCSPECQKKSWKYHKEKCKRIQKYHKKIQKYLEDE